MKLRVPFAICFLAAATLAHVATPAPAKATRPLIRTNTAIKNLKMSMPTDLKPVLESNNMGLDSEDKALQETMLRRAKVYVDYRRGRVSKEKWKSTCTSNKNGFASNEADPFCSYEAERLGQSSSRSEQKRTRVNRKEIARLLMKGDYTEAAENSTYQLIQAIDEFPSRPSLTVTAMKVAESESCMPSSVPFSFAYKLEENFPDTESVELATKLYKKASDCGTDYSAAQSSFRLGLIHLWKNDCSQVPELMMKTENQPEASHFHMRAKYWRYHCALQSQDDVAVKEIKDSLGNDFTFSFHHLVMSGDSGSNINQILDAPTPSIAFRSLIRLDLNSLLRMGEALIRADSPHLAAEVFEQNGTQLAGLEPEVRLYAAALLSREGYSLQTFKLLYSLFRDSPKMASTETLKMYFPLKYLSLVKKSARQMDPFLVLALIRQESAFNPRARSMVGARGLMQLMPATARMISRVSTSKLYEPITNIRIGTRYFITRLKHYDGDVETTLAAYNAGFGRVNQWKKRYPTDNKMLFLDFIPYRETRDYVAAILRNYYWYVKLYPQQAAPVAVEGVSVSGRPSKAVAIMNANAGAAMGWESEK